jgi:hypothetical protein
MRFISLGSSCDTKSNLERIGLHTPTLFFDYIWNELNGLKDVTKMIVSDFNHLHDITNYTKTSTHPILNWNSFNINIYYPMFVFLHHDTTRQDTIDSLNRKIERTQYELSNDEMKVFIYYRHHKCNYNTSSDINDIVDESIEFCKMYMNKYNNNFYLLSLTTYDPHTDITIIENDMATLRSFENDHLRFDFIYRRDDQNQELNKLSVISWDNIFNKYQIKSN